MYRLDITESKHYTWDPAKAKLLYIIRGKLYNIERMSTAELHRRLIDLGHYRQQAPSTLGPLVTAFMLKIAQSCDFHEALESLKALKISSKEKDIVKNILTDLKNGALVRRFDLLLIKHVAHLSHVSSETALSSDGQ